MKKLYVLLVTISAFPLLSTASITYQKYGVEGLIIDIEHNFHYDIDLDGTLDFQINQYPNKMSIRPEYAEGCFAKMGVSNYDVRFYTEGEFITDTTIYEDIEPTHIWETGVGAIAPWQNGQEYILGFMLWATYRFGWMRIRVDGANEQLYIIEAAYGEFGVPIKAGDRGMTAVEELPTFSEFALAPNPSNGTFAITFNQHSDGPLTLEIFDASGRAVLTEQISNNKGQQRHDLDLTALNNGQYFVRLQSDGYIRQRKLVLTN